MRGEWRGFPVTGHFYNHHDRNTDTWSHHTDVSLGIDPPLHVGGTEVETLVFDPELVLTLRKRCLTEFNMVVTIGDGGFYGTWNHYEESADRYRAVFELFAWAAPIFIAKSKEHPPPWLIALEEAWPSLAQGWGLQLDVARAEMTGVVRGLPTKVYIRYHVQGRGTYVEVAVPMPEKCELWLKEQDGDGFFDRLFRGQDVRTGDKAFDDAFVVKGEPEEFVRAALSPAARQQLLHLLGARVAITLEGGKLVAIKRGVVTDREQLDQLMKAAYTAATALYPQAPAAAPLLPYR